MSIQKRTEQERRGFESLKKRGILHEIGNVIGDAVEELGAEVDLASYVEERVGALSEDEALFVKRFVEQDIGNFAGSEVLKLEAKKVGFRGFLAKARREGKYRDCDRDRMMAVLNTIDRVVESGGKAKEVSESLKKEFKSMEKEEAEAVAEYLGILKDKSQQRRDKAEVKYKQAVKEDARLKKRLEQVQRLDARSHDPGFLFGRPTGYELMMTDMRRSAPKLYQAHGQLRKKLKEITDGIYEGKRPVEFSDFERIATSLGIKDLLQKWVYTKQGDPEYMMRMLFNTYVFEFYGKQVFAPTPKMMDMLEMTDPNVDKYFLAPPYPSFYVQFPYGRFGRYQKETDKIHVIDGAFVAMGFLDNETDTVVTEGTDALSIIFFMNDDLENPVNGKIGQVSHTLIFEEGNVLTTFNKFKEKFVKEGDIDNFSGDIEATKACLNIVLYLSSKGTDCVTHMPDKRNELLKKARVGKPKQKARRFEKIKQYSYLTKIVLGENTSFEAPDGTTAEQRRINARFMVRGHFRTYKSERYNQELREKTARQPQWIKPYWKGPEYAEAAVRKYSLETKKKKRTVH